MEKMYIHAKHIFIGINIGDKLELNLNKFFIYKPILVLENLLSTGLKAMTQLKILNAFLVTNIYAPFTVFPKKMLAK